MKHVKKLLSVILVMIMAMTLALPAAAAGGRTLTINSKTSGHTYQAYQVFSGRLDSTGKLLADIDWGTNITNKDTALAAVKALKVTVDGTEKEIFSECVTATDVADVLGANKNNSELLDKFASTISEYVGGTPAISGTPTGNAENGYVYTISGLADGYYFVTEAPQENTEANWEPNNSYTKYMLQVVGDTTVNAKTDVPSAVKKVQENVKYPQNDTYVQNYTYGQGYNDVADYNIGDTVPFSFYSAVPDMTNFKTYKYIFHDNMSSGLTFNADSVEVWIGGMELDKDDYRVVTSESLGDGHAHTRGFDVVIDDLKLVAARLRTAYGSDIRVNFTATLNDGAVIGLDGNPNTLTLEYSNNPNDEAQTTTGTPDTVIVFTYELDVTKVDGKTLDANGKIIDTTKMLGDVEFKLYKKVTENGKEVTKYVTVADNGKVTGWVTETDDTEGKVGSVLKTAADGTFKVSGLDDGVYYLEETKPKDGYNTIKDPIQVAISAVTANGQNWTDGTAANALTALNITIGEGNKASTTPGDINTGIVSTIVENNKGIQLPGTGGIGTTIFYVVGGILVVGAAVLLIAKKRTK
ncbi:isopeptide-forming domain-containing fimbrial protein [Frisingicoccus sp.]|uniref:isopeptide-forming domain-containing fimbrial protein n=1 Tax=Frisingicoccus sp. TaxID=1918627 RepID=UPI003AB597B8